MTQKQRMIGGKLYDASDKELADARLRARDLVYQFNSLPPQETEEAQRLLKELLGKTGKRFMMEPPFRCDYGSNISIGENFYANFGCVILDCAPVTIGDNVMFGPNVNLYAAGHPVDAGLRTKWLEYAFPITIGDNVWIGGGTCVNPGVTIGADTVIGAGSVVTKDIPAGVVAAGNPCRVLREITERDRTIYFKGHALDGEEPEMKGSFPL